MIFPNSCSFVFNNFWKIRVRVHSCSGEHERTPVFALYVFVFVHPWSWTIPIGHASYIVNCLYIVFCLQERDYGSKKEFLFTPSRFRIFWVTNFQDGVDNWIEEFRSLSPSKNEALGSHLSFYKGHVTLVATSRCVLGVFRIGPIFKIENFNFRNHVTSW